MLAAALTLGALPWTAPDAAAECTFYCWHVTEGNSCCQTFTCEIIC